MFAYCLNNPVNRVDSLGTAGIWYYLIVEHDMGLIHRLVQAHILANNPNLYVELVLPGYGRADVVDVSVGAVWEVKHAGKDPMGRTAIAAAQAAGYVGGVQGGVTVNGLGAAGEFSGSFVIILGENTYCVEYSTPVDGVILYSVADIPRIKVPADCTVYAFDEALNPQKDDALACVLGGLAFCPAGAGFGGCFGGRNSELELVAFGE